jgi:hypothetical protein
VTKRSPKKLEEESGQALLGHPDEGAVKDREQCKMETANHWLTVKAQVTPEAALR